MLWLYDVFVSDFNRPVEICFLKAAFSLDFVKLISLTIRFLLTE